MNYHEDGYGGAWYDDNDYTPDDPDYQYSDDDWDNYEGYDGWSDPARIERIIANARYILHAIRYRVDGKYRERIDDIPF